jgi:hypothetical protein
MLPFRRTDKLIQEIEKEGSLYFLLNALIGAYNRRTDILAKGTDNSELENKIDRLSQEIATIGARLELIVESLEKPKPLEVKFVFKVANDHQDEPFSISIGGVTDAEGEPLPNNSALTVDVKSSDDSVVGVSFDPSTNSGIVSFGHSGVASLTASVTNAKGEILGSGAADFTVTTGDPAAVSDVKIAFGGLTEEPPATEPTT